jgi:hypothetical protein
VNVIINVFEPNNRHATANLFSQLDMGSMHFNSSPVYQSIMDEKVTVLLLDINNVTQIHKIKIDLNSEQTS